MSVALVPAGIPAEQLTTNERSIADGLLERLSRFQGKNSLAESYYNARQRVRDLGIAIPPHLTNLEAAIGWPAMAVDVLSERLTHDGWMIPGEDGDRGVADIVEVNKLSREFRSGRTKAMQYGVSFGVVSSGRAGEPNPLVTVESPQRMTVTWDARRRQVTEALLVTMDDRGEVAGATLWYGPVVLELERNHRGWQLLSRRSNRIGRPPVVPLINRFSVGYDHGQSEITRPLRAYTDNAVRTIVSMEVSRDFHAAPKFWLLGADESQFVGPDGTPKTAWETYIGRLNAIPSDSHGNNADVKQFQGASPAPFIEHLRALAQMVSAETALPIAFLGLAHDANPASADAALIAEARLNRRAELRVEDFSDAEGELMRLALWVRDGFDPGVTPRPIYRPVATPTHAAMADAAVKLTSGDNPILPAQSDVTWKRVGLTEPERRQVRADLRRERAAQVAGALAAAADQARQDGDVADLSALRD